MYDPCNFPPLLTRACQETLSVVSRHTEIPSQNILSPSRKQEVVIARWLTMLALQQQGFSNLAIGKAIQRDKSTVYHGLCQAKALIQKRAFMQDIYVGIVNDLKLEGDINGRFEQ